MQRTLPDNRPDIHAPDRYQTHNPSKQVAADPCLTALDCAATGIGNLIFNGLKKISSQNYETSTKFMEKLLDWMWNNLMHTIRV
jgi:hypothetical protein